MLLTVLMLLVVGAVALGVVLGRSPVAAPSMPVLLGEPVPDPHAARLAALELLVADLRRQITPPRPIPVVELWLMDRDERTIHHTLHVATRLREPEVAYGGQVYLAAREAQPGYWIYRSLN